MSAIRTVLDLIDLEDHIQTVPTMVAPPVPLSWVAPATSSALDEDWAALPSLSALLSDDDDHYDNNKTPVRRTSC